MMSFPPETQKTLWSRGLARSRDKLNMLILHYHNDYGYKTWQGGSIQWRTSFNKDKKFTDHVVLQGQVNKLNTLSLLTKEFWPLNLAK